jgi:hypothetical protein
MRESSPTLADTEGASLPANLSGRKYRTEWATLKSESRSDSDLSLSKLRRADPDAAGSAHGESRRQSVKLSGL